MNETLFNKKSPFSLPAMTKSQSTALFSTSKICPLSLCLFNTNPTINLSLCSPILVNKIRKEPLKLVFKLKDNYETKSMKNIRKLSQSPKYPNGLSPEQISKSIKAFTNNYSCFKLKKANNLVLSKKEKCLSEISSKERKDHRMIIKNNNKERLNRNTIATNGNKETIINGSQLMRNISLECNSALNINSINKMQRLYTNEQLGLGFLRKNSKTNSNSGTYYNYN